MGKNYLNELNIKKIKGSKFVANGYTYFVVSAKMINKKLCLTLVDLNDALNRYGEEETKEIVEKIRQSSPSKTVEFLEGKHSSLPYVVLYVYNPFMRGVNFSATRKKYSTDYYIIGENSNGEDSLFRIYEDGEEGELIAVDPFVNTQTGEPWLTLEEVKFPQGEIAMREIFASALGDSTKNFKREFSNECMSVLYAQNAEFIKEQKAVVAEAKRIYTQEAKRLKDSKRTLAQYKTMLSKNHEELIK